MDSNLKKLTKNAAECKECGARIQSKFVNDIQACDCWDRDYNHGIWIKGGLSYHKYHARNPLDYKDLCEYEDIDE